MTPVLSIEGLAVEISGRGGVTHAIRDVSLRVNVAEIVGVVGETGSGKTMTGMAVLGLLPAGASVRGTIELDGRDLLARPGAARRIRGSEVAMIFQNPGSAFNPVNTIGEQFVRVIRTHRGGSHKAAAREAARLLTEVELPDAARVLRSYPHQLSGGMLQRAMIALALSCQPRLIIADEATTALDVTVARQIMRLLLRLQRAHRFGVLFISHNLAEARDVCDRVYVLNDGRVVEHGPVERVFGQPEHPYTRTLLSALSGDGGTADRAGAPTAPMVEIHDLVKHFRPHRGAPPVRAVDGVQFRVPTGATYALVGESGSGKTTIARCLLGLEAPTAGSIRVAGCDLATLSASRRRQMQRRMAIVFQNPYAALNPRMTVARLVGEPARLAGVRGAGLRARVLDLLIQVGLAEEHLDRFPHELSGGQCQRVAIARALAVEPRLLVLDEPTSALDVSVQAQILDLLARLRYEHSLTYLLISHDLSVVRRLADRIGVMYRGRMVEENDTDALFDHPSHPYTLRLLDSVPGRGRAALETEPTPGVAT
jgi:peptide/nickel transport system ATP-binding protein